MSATLDDDFTESAPHPQPRKRRWLRTLGRIFLVCLLIFAIQYGVRYYLAERELQAAIEEVDRRDPGWRLEELEASRAMVPDAQNGALVVLAAGKHFPKDWGTQQVFENVSAIPPAMQLHEQHISTLRAEMKAMAPALREAQKLVNYPRGRFRIAWTDDFMSTLVPHVQEVRTVVNLLHHDALLRGQDGDADGAINVCRAQLNAGRTLGDEPLILTQFIRSACRNITATTVERSVAQGQPSEEALAALQGALKMEASEALTIQGVRGERAGSHVLMTNLESGKLPHGQLAHFGSRKKYVGNWEDLFTGWLVQPQYKQSHAWWLRFYTDMIDALSGPEEEQESRLQALVAMVHEAPTIARLLTPAIGKAVETERRSVANLRCAIAGVAAERYRCKVGSWPKQLADLVTAKLLKAVPIDPYDGKPLRLRHAKDGIVIYSLGPQGNNDGKALDDGRFDPNETRTEFRLWDVARRRQPAVPPPPERIDVPLEEPEGDVPEVPPEERP